VKRTLLVTVAVVLTAVGAAVAYYTTARERDYRALLARGDAALRDDQTYVALEAYSGAVALRPDSMLAHLRRAEAYQRRGEIDEAARDFRTAAALDPTATRPLDELGDLMCQRQRFRVAAEMYESCLKLDERSARVSYKLALARYRDGDMNAALLAARQAIRLNDRMPEAYYVLGLALREKRRTGEAQQAFEKAIALAPDLVAAHEELAEIHAGGGRRADELAQLQTIANLDRDHVERQVAVALAHTRAGNTDLAVTTLSNALERAPDQPLVYAALGRVWLDIALTRKDHPEALSKALEALARAASTSAATSEVLTLYGRALLLDGAIELAALTLERATTRYPIDPAALLLQSTTAERMNDPDTARHALIKYVAIVPDGAEFAAHAAHIGALSLRVNDVATAVEWLQRAIVAAPNDVRALTSLADAQVRSGDLDAARITIARGLEKDPANPQLFALAKRTGKSGIRNWELGIKN
jgi:Tfp pilus assembly protein PilF